MTPSDRPWHQPGAHGDAPLPPTGPDLRENLVARVTRLEAFVIGSEPKPNSGLLRAVDLLEFRLTALESALRGLQQAQERDGSVGSTTCIRCQKKESSVERSEKTDWRIVLTSLCVSLDADAREMCSTHGLPMVFGGVVEGNGLRVPVLVCPVCNRDQGQEAWKRAHAAEALLRELFYETTMVITEMESAESDEGTPEHRVCSGCRYDHNQKTGACLKDCVCHRVEKVVVKLEVVAPSPQRPIDEAIPLPPTPEVWDAMVSRATRAEADLARLRSPEIVDAILAALVFRGDCLNNTQSAKAIGAVLAGKGKP